MSWLSAEKKNRIVSQVRKGRMLRAEAARYSKEQIAARENIHPRTVQKIWKARGV